MILNLTHVKFKMLIWPDGNYLMHRHLPLEVKALKKANRYAGVSIVGVVSNALIKD